MLLLAYPHEEANAPVPGKSFGLAATSNALGRGICVMASVPTPVRTVLSGRGLSAVPKSRAVLYYRPHRGPAPALAALASVDAMPGTNANGLNNGPIP